ncbi:hypothetical protein KQI63_02225 [bacterium]|nr:hypothetical protein [bacterium]
MLPARLKSILFGLISGIAILFALSTPSYAQISVTSLSVLWEDSLAVVQPVINDPFSKETRQTLESGMPVAVDVEVQFIRTGYVKRLFKRVVVKYNVWTERYRVLTPIGPLAIKDYETVLNLFHNNLIITMHERELDPTEQWFVKVRVGERRVLRDEDLRSDALSRIEDDLPGIAGWLFRQGRPRETYSDWSPLAMLGSRGVD